MAIDLSSLSAAELAEDAMGYVPIIPPSTREVRDDMVLTASPLPDRMVSTVSRIRWDGGDIAERVAEVRAHFAERGTAEFCWWLGPSTTPPGLREALLELGAVPELWGERATAMVLDHPPVGERPSGVEVVAVDDLDRYRTLVEILFELDDDTPAEQRDAVLAGLPERWERYRTTRVGFLAYVDGVAASAGQVSMLDARRGLLTGGATRPWARGRGCYRALVVERWKLMSERGAEAFVVQASDMSAPLLAALGFRTTATLTVLADRSAQERSVAPHAHSTW